LLVTGERGVGKSIAVRVALTRLKEIRGKEFFPIIVPGERCTNVKNLIEELANTFADQVRIYFKDDEDILKQTIYLKEVIRCDELSHSELYKKGKAINENINIDYGLLNFIRASLGFGATFSSDLSKENVLKVTIDNTTRVKLIAKIMSKLASIKDIEPLFS
jgi:hypothetical protein